MSPFPQFFSHANQFCASLLLEELVRLGVRHACIAPGSRSTPLTLAAIAHSQLETPCHFDERGLGFFALGIAKATQAPVAVIVTSGSAVANLYPAVVEAYQTQHPLILLTADRPDELIDCGANQAIEQPGLFSHFTTARLDLPPPTPELDYADLLKQVDWAVQSQPKGPVHINCPFREPLYPSAQQQDFAQALASLAEWQHSDQPLHPIVPQAEAHRLTLPNVPGVIIAGSLSQAEQQAALKLQQQLGWPLLADVQSGLRSNEKVLHYPELTLKVPHLAEQVESCQQFILLGGRLVSKPLQQWLQNKAWQFSCQISDHPGPFDADLVIMKRINASVQQLEFTSDSSTACLNSQAANQQIATLLKSYENQISECTLASKLQEFMPSESYLMLGNSLPIRLFEQRYTGSQTLITNRGASGIDGLLATAAGIARGQQQPVTLVLGDLSLLHDLNSLALNRQINAPLMVIVLNNDGGNIFDLLPVPDPQTLDDYYRLRHGHQFAASAHQFGWHYHQPNDWQSLEQVYRQGLQEGGAHLIELITPPGEAVSQLKQALADAAQL